MGTRVRPQGGSNKVSNDRPGARLSKEERSICKIPPTREFVVFRRTVPAAARDGRRFQD